MPLQQHLSRLACADLYLDAWPCNAHTTAGEALWVGVPVVTLQGRTFAQRVAASLLHAVQLDELVCHDMDGYRDTVLALAADAPRRAALRSIWPSSSNAARCSMAPPLPATSRPCCSACGSRRCAARRRSLWQRRRGRERGARLAAPGIGLQLDLQEQILDRQELGSWR